MHRKQSNMKCGKRGEGRSGIYKDRISGTRRYIHRDDVSVRPSKTEPTRKYTYIHTYQTSSKYTHYNGRKKKHNKRKKKRSTFNASINWSD